MGVRVPCDVVSRDVYTTVTGLAASSAGDLVVSGDCFGRLAVFNSGALLGADNEDESDTDGTPSGGHSVHHSRPSVALCTRYGPVQQLVSNGERHLMAVCGNSVYSFQWSDIATAAAAAAVAATGTTDHLTSCKPPRAVWSITAGPAGLGGIESADVCGADGQLCVAAGGSVLVYCQETRQLVHRLASLGRSRDPAAAGADTVRCVRCVRAAPWSPHAATAELVTCGDDGCLRVWDLRCPRTPTAQLVPPHSSSSSGSGGGACERGSRLNAVDAVGEWVVCGGRASASTVFHRRSTGVLATLVPDTTTTAAAAVTSNGAPAHTHVTRFVDASGAVAVGRNCAGVEIYSSTTTTAAAGDSDGGAICRPTTTLDTSATAVFALLVLPPLRRRRQLILAAGCGAQLDVCTAQYRDVTVSCLSPVEIPV